MPPFMPGLELCRLFYEEAVKPILQSEFPGLRYAAARIGSGSDVLGFDTEMSTDHDWGPALLLFLEEQDLARFDEAIREILSRRLQPLFYGYPTGYAPNDDGTLRLGTPLPGVVHHRVQPISIASFVHAFLKFDIHREIEIADWLTFPEQKLRALTAGAVFHDDIGLQVVRDRFALYPRDVWLYLLAAGWNRIGQEEHLMGRAGSAGDELGSALIGARLVRDIMRLCFLMEREYAPYPKWLGTAFNRLKSAPRLEPVLRSALHAKTWQEREAALVTAYETIAAMHNALALTEPLPEKAVPFYNRPFQVIHLGADFAGALCRLITDPKVKRLGERRLIGSIDQISDNTDLLCCPDYRETLRRLYD